MYKNKIRVYRKEVGMKLEDMAKRVGISTGYLCHLEKGTRRNPSTKIMENIAKVLKKMLQRYFLKRIRIHKKIGNKSCKRI